MPTVEEVYHQAWGKVGGVGRLRRTFSLFAEFWEMLELQIRQRPSGTQRSRAQQVELRSECIRQTRPLNACSIAWNQKPCLPMIFTEPWSGSRRSCNDLGFKFHFTGGRWPRIYGDPQVHAGSGYRHSDLPTFQPETKNAFEPPFLGIFHSRAGDHGCHCAEKGLFQAIDELSMVKIDFHVGEKIPGELDRSISARSRRA